MSRVYLLRHAKAVTALPGMRDFDRPLDTSGRELAAKLGATMLANGLVPEKIICSPSARTRETLTAISTLLPFEIDTQFERALFDGGGDPYMAAIISSGEADSIMLVGHNPMTEELAFRLCASGNSAAMAKLQHGFPTGGLAIIDLPGPLSGAGPHTASLVGFITGGKL